MTKPASSTQNRSVPFVEAAFLGALGALVALAFVALVAAGEGLLWPDEPEPTAWSGSVRILVIMTAAGFLVGSIHAFMPAAQEQNVFVALATGKIDRRAIPGALIIALVTLIGGFSLGPEVPTGMAAAGIAGWLATKRRQSAEKAEGSTATAISGAWGGLFTAPFTALLLNVELNMGRRALEWNRVLSDAIAAIVGFSIFFAVEAGWSDVLRLIDLPVYSLEIWQLGVAAGLGLAGAVVGTLFKLTMLATSQLAGHLSAHPILRGVIGGAALGLLAMALPLTLFLGTDGLVQITSDPAALGIGLIVVSVLAKILATSGALSFGFVGGPIFPLLFVGGGVGAAVNLMAPDVPLALAVTASMAAVAAAVVPVPLSLATLVVLIGGVGATEAAGIFTAAIVATTAGRGIEAVLPSRQNGTGQKQSASS